jgi:hypothetical protein
MLILSACFVFPWRYDTPIEDIRTGVIKSEASRHSSFNQDYQVHIDIFLKDLMRRYLPQRRGRKFLEVGVKE